MKAWRRRTATGPAGAGRAAGWARGLARVLAGALAASGAARAARAAEATADDPHYGDRKLWAAEVEKTAYFRQTWPQARRLVWARADAGADRGIDPLDPKNWLEDGKPAASIFDENTDLVFPDSDVRYSVTTQKNSLLARHVTVGRGAHVSLQKLSITGNLWIKSGGTVSWLEELKGPRNTFARNDNPPDSRSARIANKLTLTKPRDASAEIVGCIETGDDLNLLSGTFIVGPGATFRPGDRSIQGIAPDARLVLMSGSRFHKRGNQHYGCEIVVAGELLAGTPERSLTKDCFLGLSYKNHRPGDARIRGSPDFHGLVVLKDGAMRVSSADPAKARLVLGWHGQPRSSGVGGDPGRIPEKIDLVLLGKLAIDGIEFNDVLRGGILMPDPAARARWSHVTFGKGNEGPPDELFRRYSGPTEFGLTG